MVVSGGQDKVNVLCTVEGLDAERGWVNLPDLPRSRKYHSMQSVRRCPSLQRSSSVNASCLIECSAVHTKFCNYGSHMQKAVLLWRQEFRFETADSGGGARSEGRQVEHCCTYARTSIKLWYVSVL